MIREEDILLLLYNNPWFKPSRNGETKALTNRDGTPILGKDGKQIEAPLSYYHICSNGNAITMRVSNHGTALQTWVKHQPDPANQLQNISVVFANGPVHSTTRTEAIDVLNSDGTKERQYKFFVVEQFIYQISNQSQKSVEKIIQGLKRMDEPKSANNTVPSVFKDPLRKDKKKRAGVQILVPTDTNGDDLSPSINPVHHRQSDLLKTLKINEGDLISLIAKSIAKVLLG